jgi:hypothetical protein
MAPQFYRYSDPLNPLKALSAASGLGGIIIGAWADGVTFSFNGSGIALGAVSGIDGNFGYAGLVPNVSGGLGLLRFQDTFTFLTPAGGIENFPAPSGAVQTNLFNALTVYNNTPFMADVSGNVFSFNGASGTVSQFGAFGQPTIGLAVAGASLYAAAPASGLLVSCSLTSAVTGSIAAPVATPSCIAGSGSLIALGGWGQANIASGFTQIAPNPVDTILFTGITTGASGFTSWLENASGIWSQQQHLTNTQTATQMNWTALGNSLLVANTISGTVDIYGLSLNVISLAQSLPVSGASSIATAPNSINGLVCSIGQNLVTSIYETGSTWFASGSVSIASPNSAIAESDGTHAYVGGTSGLSLMTLFGDMWELTSTIALPFTPKYLTSGSNGIYAAGASGASGFVYSVAGAVSGSFVGGVSGLLAINGQVLLLDPTGVLRFFDQTTLVQAGSATISSGALSMAQIGTEIFVSFPGITQQYALAAPYTTQNVKTSTVGIYNTATSGWINTTLGPDLTPQALTFDVSGNVTVATLENYILTIAASGGISAQRQIPVFSGQIANTQMGLSSLTWINSRLYVTSSMNECFMDLTS